MTLASSPHHAHVGYKHITAWKRSSRHRLSPPRPYSSPHDLLCSQQTSDPGPKCTDQPPSCMLNPICHESLHHSLENVLWSQIVLVDGTRRWARAPGKHVAQPLCVCARQQTSGYIRAHTCTPSLPRSSPSSLHQALPAPLSLNITRSIPRRP